MANCDYGEVVFAAAGVPVARIILTEISLLIGRGNWTWECKQRKNLKKNSKERMMQFELDRLAHFSQLAKTTSKYLKGHR